MSALAIVGETAVALESVVEQCASLEQMVRDMDPEALPNAWAHTRALSEWLRVRRAAEDASIAAKRLEARLLRRFGQAGVEAGLSSADKGAARYLASVADQDFEAFVDALAGAGRVSSDVTRWRREREDAAWRAMRRDRAALGDAPEYGRRAVAERQGARDAALTLVEDLVASGSGRGSADLIDELARDLGMDVVDVPARQGLSVLITQATASVAAESVTDVWMDADGAFLRGDVPPVIVFRDEDGWMRAPWSAAGIRQLLQMVERVEDQARERAAAAASLRGVYEIVAEVRSRSGAHEVEGVADLLTLGRLRGWVQSHGSDDPSPVPLRERFPRAYRDCEGWAARHMDGLLAEFVEAGMPDEQSVDEQSAEALISTLANRRDARVTLERLADAYAPRLVGTIAHPWEMPIGWGLPEGEAEAVRAEADREIAEALSAAAEAVAS